MKKYLLICVTLAVALSSCGGGNSTSSKSKSSLSSNSLNSSISSLIVSSSSNSSIETEISSSASSNSSTSAVATSSSFSSSSVNLLNNAGFEDGLTSWTDWGGLIADTNDPHTGVGTLTISLADGGGAQEIVYSGQSNLIVSAWAKVSVDGEAAYFGVDCLDENGTRISGGHTSVGPVTSLNWTNVQAAVALVPGTAKLSIFVYHNPGPGAIFFDDIALYPGVIETLSSSSLSSSSENSSLISSSVESSSLISSSESSSLESSSLASVDAASSSSLNSISSSNAFSSDLSSTSISSSDSSSSSVIVVMSSSSSSIASSSSSMSSVIASSSSSMSSLTASSSSSSAISLNLLSNSGFENSLTDWIDWGGLVVETTDVHAGTSALTIALSDGGGAQEVVYSGQSNLTVGAWAKVSVTGEEAYFGVDCLDINGIRISGGHTSVGPVNSLTWTYVESPVTIVPGTAKLSIFVYHNPGPGSIFFDDITLY